MYTAFLISSETLNKFRLMACHTHWLHKSRYISQNSLTGNKSARVIYALSGEISDCTICAPYLISVPLDIFGLTT